MIRLTLLAILFFTLIALVSGVTAYLVVKDQANLRFVSEPRPDNPDYGYLEVNGKKYFQLYTTTEVIDSHVPPGSHYHRIDLRSSQPPQE